MEGIEHKDLKERTKHFAVAGVRFFQGSAKDAEAQVCGKQFLRSVTSVGANTRSSFRGRSVKEFKAKLGIVIEEADECGFWLEFMIATSIAQSVHVEPLLKESNELVPIFTALVKR